MKVLNGKQDRNENYFDILEISFLNIHFYDVFIAVFTVLYRSYDTLLTSPSMDK